MKRISGGRTSVRADAKLLSSHAGDPRAATGDTTDTSHTGQHIPARSAASYRVSPPPARGPTGPVGRHRPSTRDADTEASYPGRPAGGASHRVPVSCCLSATGVRFSVIPFPPRDRLSSRSAHRPTRGRTQTGLPRSARTSCDRGGCPLYPEDSGAHPAGSPPRPAPAASQRQSLYPATTSHHARLRFTRHQQGFNHVHPSGLPLARAPGVEPATLRLPPSFAPRRHQQRTSGAGTGHRARTWNYSLTFL